MNDYTPLKQCRKCKAEFPPTPEYFKIDKRSPSGITSVCKTCANTISQKSYANNKGARRKQSRLQRERERAPRYVTDVAENAIITVVEIQLTKNYVTVIDVEDADLASLKWAARPDKNNRVYAQRAIRKTDGKQATLPLHRVILERILGRKLQSNEHCDHADGNGLNNRRSNLRLATPSQNQANARKQSRNTSGYKGVHFSTDCQRWEANITVSGKKIYLGHYISKEEAYAAYCDASKRYNGEFARFE